MTSKKPVHVEQPLFYFFLSLATQIHLVRMAGTPVSQDASTPGFPDPGKIQRLLTRAENFGAKVWVPTRN
jgi:hypothetical protein